MPNWCCNELLIKGNKEDIDACLCAVRSELKAKDSDEIKILAFDFNKIVPMPECLNVEHDSVANDALVAFYGDEGCELLEKDEVFKGAVKPKTLKSVCSRYKVASQSELQAKLLQEHPNCKAAANQYAENVRLYGHTTWYHWSLINWGTKWNAADVVIKLYPSGQRVKLSFDTAWSPPTPVVRKLIERCPKLSITLRYWECGCGFQGVLSGKNGKVFEDSTSDYAGSRGG